MSESKKHQSITPVSDIVYPDVMAHLEEEEKKIIREIWKRVRANMNVYASELFLRLFNAHPTYLDMFPSLRDIPRSELKGNIKLIAHGAQVIYTLSAVVNEIENIDVANELLLKIARSHYKRRVMRKMFEHLGEAMLSLLIENLNDKVMNKKAIDVWNKVYEDDFDSLTTEPSTMDMTLSTTDDLIENLETTVSEQITTESENYGEITEETMKTSTSKMMPKAFPIQVIIALIVSVGLVVILFFYFSNESIESKSVSKRKKSYKRDAESEGFESAVNRPAKSSKKEASLHSSQMRQFEMQKQQEFPIPATKTKSSESQAKSVPSLTFQADSPKQEEKPEFESNTDAKENSDSKTEHNDEDG
ncbi:Globin-like protein [Dinothrombium tinctorium]|uniref:Globin-like protein n=1 Tax=Dinothrombium tinctorium TaxID=1965070 RepID=A0A3S4QJI1_9ACAR|nr:Globin-like protein [Dinothrombium tinctorium]